MLQCHCSCQPWHCRISLGIVRLSTHAEQNVSEVLVPKGAGTLLQPATKSMLKGLLPDARFALQPTKCWDHKQALNALKQDSFFSQPLPDNLAELQSNPDGHSASLSAMAGMVSYLQRSMLDKAVLGVGTVVPLDIRRRRAAAPGCDTPGQGDADEATVAASLQQSVALDASALSNLNVRVLAPCIILSSSITEYSHLALNW